LPLEYTIDHADRLVIVRGEGLVLLDDILAYFDALVAENAMSYPKLVDGRLTEPQVSDDDMLAIGARVASFAVHDPRGPIAAVAGPRSREFLQRFKNLLGARRPFEVFETVEGAQAWLGALSARDSGRRVI
jgi:hypothetical protein